MFELYNDYVLEGSSVNEAAAPTNAFNVTGGSQYATSTVQLSNKSMFVLKDRFKQSKLKSGVEAKKVN